MIYLDADIVVETLEEEAMGWGHAMGSRMY